MSRNRRPLPESAVRLVLAALEAPQAKLSSGTITRHAGEAAHLKMARISMPYGHLPVITASDDFSDSPVTLSWNEDRETFGYSSEVHGWREVDHDRITMHSIDIAVLTKALTEKCDI